MTEIGKLRRRDVLGEGEEDVFRRSPGGRPAGEERPGAGRPSRAPGEVASGRSRSDIVVGHGGGPSKAFRRVQGLRSIAAHCRPVEIHPQGPGTRRADRGQDISVTYPCTARMPSRASRGMGPSPSFRGGDPGHGHLLGQGWTVPILESDRPRPTPAVQRPPGGGHGGPARRRPHRGRSTGLVSAPRDNDRTPGSKPGR